MAKHLWMMYQLINVPCIIYPMARPLKKAAVRMFFPGVSAIDPEADATKDITFRITGKEDVDLALREFFPISYSPALVDHVTRFNWGLVGKDMKFGQYLQLLGTDCLRGFDPDIHVKNAFHFMFQEVGPFQGDCVVVVPDIRNENEAEAIRILGGHCVTIVPTFNASLTGGRDPNHPSERPVKSITQTIENPKTEAFFYNINSWVTHAFTRDLRSFSQ